MTKTPLTPTLNPGKCNDTSSPVSLPKVVSPSIEPGTSDLNQPIVTVRKSSRLAAKKPVDYRE